MKRKVKKKSSSFFRTRLRRDIAVVLGVFLFFVIVFLIHLVTIVPTRSQVEKMFTSPYTKVLAYEIWNGKPYLLFRNGNSVHFDRLVLDPLSVSLPPLPKWQWSGVWYSIPVTARKVSVGVGYCTGERMKLPPQCQDLDLFGQINDKKIIALELKLKKNGKWEHFQVAYPGFMLRLPTVTNVPVDYRFLDAQGRVVVTKDPLIPLEKPGY